MRSGEAGGCLSAMTERNGEGRTPFFWKICRLTSYFSQFFSEIVKQFREAYKSFNDCLFILIVVTDILATQLLVETGALGGIIFVISRLCLVKTGGKHMEVSFVKTVSGFPLSVHVISTQRWHFRQAQNGNNL